MHIRKRFHEGAIYYDYYDKYYYFLPYYHLVIINLHSAKNNDLVLITLSYRPLISCSNGDSTIFIVFRITHLLKGINGRAIRPCLEVKGNLRYIFNVPHYKSSYRAR